MKEITDRKDVEFLVESFYQKVVQDDVLAPFFQHLDFDKHLPKMIHFWAFVLLDEPGYTTDVTQKHSHMCLAQVHFDRWLELFNQTVDAHFHGEKAEAAKQRAFLVGWTIKSKH
ncbi:MAG: group III truncated hemoglobin [Flavobacteriales bacterium]|nr:group III truncated hemoglobin [Flavobacteriales bacterium]